MNKKMEVTDSVYLKSQCRNCGNGIEYPIALRGESIECPHCGQFTSLGNIEQPLEKHPIPLSAVQIPAYVVTTPPAQPILRGKIKTKTEMVGIGCLIQLLGLPLLFLFPIGTVVGICMLLIGSRMASFPICSLCGSRLTSRKVSICPGCNCHFFR